MKSFFIGLLLALVLLAPRPSYAAGASFALLGPSTVTVGQEFQVTVQLRGAVNVDTIRLIGSYPQDLLTWRSIRPSGAFGNVSPGNSVNEQQGTFSFGTFTLENYANGTVKTAVITVKARKVGTAVLRLVSGSAAYSAGEPSPLSLSTISIQIKEAGPIVLPEVVKEVVKDLPVTEPAKERLTLTSPTHPDSEKWYSNPNIKVTWSTEKPVASILAGFDQSPEAKTYVAIPNEATTFTAISDGLWYVHLIVLYEDKTFGRADMFFRIDRTAPRQIAPVVEQSEVPAALPNRLIFGTVDETSGVDHYVVSIDGRFASSTQETFYSLIDQSVGAHEAEVIAFDRAGNFTSGKTSYRILESGLIDLERPVQAQLYQKLALLQRLGLLIAAIFAGFCIWILFFLRRRSNKKHK